VRRLLELSVLVLALVAAGCMGGGEPEPDLAPLTGAELGWVRAYSAWAIEVNDDESATPSQGAARECEDRFERIGSPPSARLEPAAERAAEVCPLLAELGTRRRALDLVDEADELLLPFLRDEQTLALASGVTVDSRADVRLSAEASEIIGDAVEVRCWSESDWRRLVEEDNAWNDESESHVDLVGWTAPDVDRIHLVLDVCNTVARVEAGDVTEWTRSERIDAADAIETLLHETQHFVLPDASESKVECSAIRSLPAFAQRFGVSPAAAQELAELYRTEVYPDLDDEYTRGGCPRG
jgi:hypothetical protein